MLHACLLVLESLDNMCLEGTNSGLSHGLPRVVVGAAVLMGQQG